MSVYAKECVIWKQRGLEISTIKKRLDKLERELIENSTINKVSIIFNTIINTIFLIKIFLNKF